VVALDNIDPIIREALRNKKLGSPADPGGCLQPEQLAAYWGGEMEAEDKERLYSHVVACEKCLALFVETHAELQTADADAALHEPSSAAVERARKLIKEKIDAKPAWILSDLFRWMKSLIGLPSYEPLALDPLRGEFVEAEVFDKAESYVLSKRIRKLDLFFNLIEFRGNWSIQAKISGLSEEKNARVVLKHKRKELFSSSLGEPTFFFRHVPPGKYTLMVKVDKIVEAKLILDLKGKRYGRW
jgi:hypothetical protein